MNKGEHKKFENEYKNLKFNSRKFRELEVRKAITVGFSLILPLSYLSLFLWCISTVFPFPDKEIVGWPDSLISGRSTKEKEKKIHFTKLEKRRVQNSGKKGDFSKCASLIGMILFEPFKPDLKSPSFARLV